MAELSRAQIFDLLNRPGPLWLPGVDLTEADLRWADLGSANLSGANRREADLRDAQVTPAQLRRASFLQGARGQPALSG